MRFVWQSLNKLPKLRRLQRTLESNIIDFIFSDTKGDIAANRVVCEINRLGDVADRRLPLNVVLVHVHAVNQKFARTWRQETEDHIDQSALSRARRPDEADCFALAHNDIHIAQTRRQGVCVTKGEIAHFNFVCKHSLRFDNLVLLLDVFKLVIQRLNCWL